MALYEVIPVPDAGGGEGEGCALLFGILLLAVIGSCADRASGQRSHTQRAEPLPIREEVTRPAGKQDVESQYPSGVPPRQQYPPSAPPESVDAPPGYIIQTCSQCGEKALVPPPGRGIDSWACRKCGTRHFLSVPPGYTIQTCSRCGAMGCFPPLLPPTRGRTASWTCRKCGNTTKVY